MAVSSGVLNIYIFDKILCAIKENNITELQLLKDAVSENILKLKVFDNPL